MDFLKAIKDKGGKALLVGGAVIDQIQGREIKDYDFEVYNMSYETLIEVLSKFGAPNLVGKAFGVIKIRIDDIDYDFNIPRKENRIGVTHKDFDITLCPDITIKEAAMRRDITINSMAYDPLEDELYDPYGGMMDLENGCIRATCNHTFVEDPLRVLRIMQLLPRKGKYVESNTIKLCQFIRDQFDTIPKERKFEEFNKLLLKADKPSEGILFLYDCDWLKHFPEIYNMLGCEHNPEHHPEGDVFQHTLAALDCAAKLRKYIPNDWKLAYMYGMLCHDMGKPLVYDKNNLSYISHDIAGLIAANAFMNELTNDYALIDKVIAITVQHMQCWNLYKGNAKMSAYRRLHNKIRLDILYYVSKADHCSRGYDVEGKYPASENLLEKFNIIGTTERIPQILTGKELIRRGHEPGSYFGKILKAAYEEQLDGETDIEKLYEIGIRTIEM